jgi:hypothetical protein
MNERHILDMLGVSDGDDDDDEVEWEQWMEEEEEESEEEEEDDDGVMMLHDITYSDTGPEGPRDAIFLNALMHHVVRSHAHYHYDPNIPMRGFFRHAVGSTLYKTQALGLRLLYENELVLNLAIEYAVNHNVALPEGFHDMGHSNQTMCVCIARGEYSLNDTVDVVSRVSVLLCEYFTDHFVWLERSVSFI